VSGQPSTQPLDGLQLALIQNRIDGVIRSMVNTLFRTGRSIVLNTGRDFSCCILTRDDELLSMADSLPIHVMSGPDLSARAAREFHTIFRRGDAYLNNSPYHGNSHPADYSILVPVIDDEGRHHFTVCAKAHQADCGNASPSTYMAGARDVYEEGALIFPCVKVQQNYSDVEDIIRICKVRIRIPDQWWGDYLALLGAARLGERRLLELGEELGWDLLHQFCGEWFAYSEQRMIATIERLPNGTALGRTSHDPFPGVPDGIELTASVRVDAKRGRIVVDLRENPDCQPCGLNLTEATARSAAMVGVFNSIGRAVPPNAGSFRRIEVLLRDGCIVGVPKHPTSCSVATTNVADRVTNLVQRVMVDLGDGVGLAESGLMSAPSQAVISGMDPRSGGSAFMNELTLFSGGGPGGPSADGWLTFMAPNTAGMGFLNSVEIDELLYPIRIWAQRIIPDSEGAGCFRGAPGVLVEYGPVDCEFEVMYQSDGTVNPAQGAGGGGAAATAQQFRRGADGTLEELPACARVTIGPDQVIVSISCGGGGYGRPETRDVERVLHDIAEAWISESRARDVYGVVLENGEVDLSATNELRAELAAVAGVA
jgi:N-methylhydantoinase B